MGFRGHGPGHHHGMMDCGGYGITWLIVIIILLLIIATLAYKLIQNNKNESNPTETDALEILKKRYAKGELTDEEFKHKMKTINDDNSG